MMMRQGILFVFIIISQTKYMKSGRKEVSSKRSSRDESKKTTSNSGHVNNIKKISCSIPLNMPTTIASKSLMLHSHRIPKATGPHAKYSQPQALSSQHSRKLSIQQPARKESTGVIGSKQKTKKDNQNHARSNSTLSKKSFNKETKNCFKIDLSKLTAKVDRENKICLESSKQPNSAHHGARQHYQQNSAQLSQKNANNPSTILLADKQLGRGHFEFDYVIGKGGFGKVWSVQMKKNGQMYAMKEMNKTKIIAKKSIHSVLNQRELLSQLTHPFIVNMSAAFQDRQKLYLVMDLLVGGDLRYHMGCRRRFKESEAKFFIACIILGLEFLHLNNIIHRDIKPENIVFDHSGYLRITDLGIARVMKPNNSSDTSGTPGYMAPEVMCRQDHSFPVDYYAVGIIAYELMLGRRPYNGRNRRQIRDQILSKQVQIRAEEIPSGWSAEAANFINRMIQRKPCNRLGTQHGIAEIKEHPWFKNFPWGQLLKKNIQSTFVPKNILGSDDYRDQISETSENEDEQENLLLLRKEEVEELFSGYKYFCKESFGQNVVVGHKKTATTAVTKYSATTHGSYIEDREHKVKSNNFFKI